jgi:putative flavoprotein involved in K+ transport
LACQLECPPQAEGNVGAAGIERVGRVASVRDGLPVLEGDSAMEPTNITYVWCIGCDPDFPWIGLPIFQGRAREPAHDRGIVNSEPGLFFVGLLLRSLSSSALRGVGRDARHVVAA